MFFRGYLTYNRGHLQRRLLRNAFTVSNSLTPLLFELLLLHLLFHSAVTYNVIKGKMKALHPVIIGWPFIKNGIIFKVMEHKNSKMKLMR